MMSIAERHRAPLAERCVRHPLRVAIRIKKPKSEHSVGSALALPFTRIIFIVRRACYFRPDQDFRGPFVISSVTSTADFPTKLQKAAKYLEINLCINMVLILSP